MRRAWTATLSRAAPAALLVVLLAVAACAMQGGRPPHRGLESLWRKYQALSPHRALAVAGDPDRAWVAGASAAQPSDDAAQAAALEECAAHRLERRMQAPCRIYAVGDRVVW